MEEKGENKEGKIVDSNHKLLGKHVISVTVPLTLDEASETAEHLNSMPSCNYEQEMFVVKHVLELKSEVKKYIVVRKLCIGDKVDFIDYSEK